MDIFIVPGGANPKQAAHGPPRPCLYNNEVMVRVEHVLDSWKAIRQDTIAAVEEFPAAEFDFRPTPDVAPFGEIARHILDVGDGLTGLLLAGEEDFATPERRARMKQYLRNVPPGAGALELAAALRASIEERTAALAAQTADFYAHMVTRVDGLRVTRLELLQFIKEHELTHRAQLFMDLRLKGIVPATTRRRLARQAGR
jgi:uncharacterized damage-inducible protein DinB